MAEPFAPEQLNAFFRVEPIDDDLDRRAGQRQSTLELVDGKNSFALSAQVDEDALAAHADDLAGAEARAGFPGLGRGRQPAGDRWACGTAATPPPTVAGSNPARAASSSASRPAVPLALERQVDVSPGSAGSPAGGRVQGGVDRVVRCRTGSRGIRSGAVAGSLERRIDFGIGHGIKSRRWRGSLED